MTSELAQRVEETLDLRQITPRQRHALVFGQFDALQPGRSMQLINDHDPRPLRQQFDERCHGQFEWAALQAGPALWRVLITRTTATAGTPAGDACCSGGACCG